ncbi:hypothetical protein [Lentzea sp. NBRC 102530]|uniref:hypothetical protein n=1 Tax=Lentzea sp. NBRC 102530 TaxID=3032201 RepID=UPI002555EAB3|nr:hypothetical protein [Lentzea sp. NBRC 102530]
MRKYVLAILAAFAALISVAVPSSAAPVQAQDLKILHSFGYKHLLLGMKPAQAEATGLLTDKDTSGGQGWAFYQFVASEGDRGPNTWVAAHETCGVQMIIATYAMKTPRGIGVGSSRADLVRAYPSAHADPTGKYDVLVDAPLNPGFQYAFVIDYDTDEVTWMSLEKKGGFC